DVFRLEESLPYSIELTWSDRDDDGSMSARFRHRESDSAFPDMQVISVESPALYANDPLRGLVAREVIPELSKSLDERLPSYLVPSALVVLPSLPLTPNGKLDRKALPAPESIPSGETSRFVPARTPTEEVVAGIFAEVLGVERVSVEDSFFDLGGHSLLATQVVSRLKEAYPLAVHLRSIFERPTPESLSRLLLQDPAARENVERISETLLRLSELSEEDAKALLAEGTTLARETEP
ncbi:MAG: phosphopantetheine-binding protein, partial [Vicinamibacteria bacterium]